ncbi:hypothetical protein [Paracoccus simplex]|uniref:Secreted protein n=1 Tax=Paracoccus simplex TaxID=2086346 RepID=A0ABV7RXG4_9RHOB
MRMALSHLFALVPVSSQAWSRLAAFPVGRAEGSERVEGKIKETGTLAGRFRGKPLSAHCFGAARTAPWFRASRVASWRKALALQGFERHHSPKSDLFRRFSIVEPEARP